MPEISNRWKKNGDAATNGPAPPPCPVPHGAPGSEVAAAGCLRPSRFAEYLIEEPRIIKNGMTVAKVDEKA